ncbi:galactosyltransferase-related protein [Streptomyces koyangensis]|uniref:galactosyltransferase-related protein n=1 Tax=Streptomyces koyangensis TaxID=188770 RepID=UPI003C2F8B3E
MHDGPHTERPAHPLDALAHTLAEITVGWLDPHSRISPPLWDRVAPLYEEVYASVLGTHGAVSRRRLPESALPRPGDDAAFRALAAAVRASLERDEEFAERSRLRLIRIEEFARLVPHHGAAYGDQPEPMSLDRQIEVLAGAAVPPPRAEGPVGLSFVLAYRAGPSDPHRVRNLLACLAALGRQDVPRSGYRVIAVEQDVRPRLRELVEPLVDDYVFAPNPGAYNYAWGRNIGVRAAPGRGPVCLLDIDMVVPEDFVRKCRDTMGGEVGAVLPYDEVLYLDERSSSAVVGGLAASRSVLPAGALRGSFLREVRGGAVVVDRAVYERIGGQDERFRGWGDEDNEFYRQLRAVTEMRRLPGVMHHLDHPRPVMRRDGGRVNAPSMAVPRSLGEPFGDVHRFQDEVSPAPGA